MKVRGQRECGDCGARWSYYDTGSVECPDCGSLRSVGVDDERRLHTDSPAEFDLSEARELVDAKPLREVADRAGEVARAYVRQRGFVRGGDLLALDDTYLAAQELRHAADVVRRGLDVSDDEEWYFLELLRSADAEDGPTRPASDEVPASMHPIRGLAAADAAGEYRSEMSDWLDAAADDASAGTGVDAQAARNALATLETHVKRVRALEGDVEPATADRLVAAARDVGRYLREADADALASARDRFDRLA
ncbi:DUF7117 family protein [Halorussus halobius]|uniref:DUF7117 family protein n=1 Tax=Halorussus halobius TaxID=1710537 RepID=UPI001091B0EF|nr:TFIIB-type zinc ribbon-containing protein [Halorussus halobius]